MVESIGTKITSLCCDIVPFYLAEAEIEGYPYAIYEQTVQPYRTKDGIYKYTADTTIRIYSTVFSEAQTAADAIKAVLDDYSDGQFTIRLRAFSKDCTEGVWVIELNYFVKQTS